MSVSDLIGRYIVEDPYRPGPADARLVQYGTHVWAIVSYYQQAVNGDLAQTARDYDIPPEVVEAALAYYEKYRPAIDARILLNDSSAA